MDDRLLIKADTTRVFYTYINKKSIVENEHDFSNIGFLVEKAKQNSPLKSRQRFVQNGFCGAIGQSLRKHKQAYESYEIEIQLMSDQNRKMRPTGRMIL